MAKKTTEKSPAPSLEWPTALKVECPTCQRKVEERCLMSGSGKESPRPHRERLKAGEEWERLRQAEADDGSVAPGTEDVLVTPLSKKKRGKSSAEGSPGETTLTFDVAAEAQRFVQSEALERLKDEDAKIGGIKLAQRLMGDRAFYLRCAELVEKEWANQHNATDS